MKPLRNVRLKLVALALALITWFALRGRTLTVEQSDYLRCPVTLLAPDDVMVRNKELLTIELKVQARGATLARFQPSAAILRVDAQREIEHALADGAPSATVSKEITRRDFSLPHGVELVDFSPTSISFRVERLEQVTLPVRVTFRGEPADGYRIVNDPALTRASPSTITLQLGAREAAEITAIETTPVDVTGCRGTIRDTVFLLDPRGKRTQRDQTVDVVVAIEPELGSKPLSPVPIMVLQRPTARSRVEIDPDTVTIDVRGRTDLLASLGPEAVAAYLVIDEKLDPGVYTLPLVVISKKPGLEIVKAPTVQVTIE